MAVESRLGCVHVAGGLAAVGFVALELRLACVVVSGLVVVGLRLGCGLVAFWSRLSWVTVLRLSWDRICGRVSVGSRLGGG